LNLALRGLEATQHQLQELVTVVKDQSQQIELLISKNKEQSKQIERQSGQIERLASKDKERSEQIERQSQQIERLLSNDKEKSQQITIVKINQTLSTPFEWKIPKFDALFLTKDSERQILDCKPFYLFECGYKYLLEILITRPLSQNFLRVFIKVVPGEFDELLPWPCKERVRVTLVNQDLPPDNRKNISHVIDFEMAKEPCSRPLRDRDHKYRPSLGLARHELRSFIKNETILIRVNREKKDLRN